MNEINEAVKVANDVVSHASDESLQDVVTTAEWSSKRDEPYTGPPLFAGENSITLDGLEPQTVAEVARAAQRVRQRRQDALPPFDSYGTDYAMCYHPDNIFRSEADFTEHTGLRRGAASGDRFNCLLNSCAQALGLLEPSRARDRDVCSQARPGCIELRLPLTTV